MRMAGIDPPSGELPPTRRRTPNANANANEPPPHDHQETTAQPYTYATPPPPSDENTTRPDPTLLDLFSVNSQFTIDSISTSPSTFQPTQPEVKDQRAGELCN